MKTLMTYWAVFLFSISGLFGQAQKQFYQMKALGIDIGTLQINRKQVGDDIYYQNKTKFDVNLLFKKVQMEIESRAHYRLGQLMTANSRLLANGEVRSTCQTVWEEKQYEIQLDGKPRSNLKAPITYSGTVLFFKEPHGFKEVFSESSGVFMTIMPVKQGVYRITDPENNRDMIRIYEKGQQTRVKIKHPLLTISLIRLDTQPGVF